MQPKANLYTNFLRSLAAIACALAAGCSTGSSNGTGLETAPDLAWSLVSVHPHSTERFTQGLTLRDGAWLESSGGFGSSFLVLETADDRQHRYALPSDQFAEGATFVDDRVWLLTWRAGTARAFDRNLKLTEVVRYAGEGWGLTYDGETLIMSDGSDYLTRRDPATFAALSGMQVRDAETPITRLNELEYAHGLIWANVFGTSRIAAIAPNSGRVCGWLRLGSLEQRIDKFPGWDDANNVLNGIAVDSTTGHLHVTGKRWPKRFEIQVTRPPWLTRCAQQ